MAILYQFYEGNFEKMGNIAPRAGNILICKDTRQVYIDLNLSDETEAPTRICLGSIDIEKTDGENETIPLTDYIKSLLSDIGLDSDGNLKSVATFISEKLTPMKGAEKTKDGEAGLVPAPVAGKQASFLRGDGEWATPTNTKYSAANDSITLTNTAFSITKNNVNYILNLLEEGDRNAQASDYIIAQYVGGNEGDPKNTNFYRRSADKIVNATLVKAALDVDAEDGTQQYLKKDGTWAVPTGTTYSVFIGSGAGAKAGLVPKPPTTAGTKQFLCENGNWAVPPDTNTTYSAATTSVAGLMSAADKTKLDGIATGANNYSLPSATSSTLGGVKIGNNITVSSGTISLTKANVTTALGYTPPTTNTTYSVVSTTADGLAPKRDGSTTKYLRADGTWATPPDTNTTYTAATAAPIIAGTAAAGTSSKYAREDHVHPAQTDITGNANNVTGVVAIANGGTGKTSAKGAVNALFAGVPTGTSTGKNWTDEMRFIAENISGDGTYYTRTMSDLWLYVKKKIASDTDGITANKFQYAADVAVDAGTELMRPSKILKDTEENRNSTPSKDGRMIWYYS